MYIVIGILIGIIVIQWIVLWKYQRQVKDICRQLTFLMKHDSNMLINREFDMGGIGILSDRLNELLELRRKEKRHYQEKEALIADTYTNLSHDIRTPLTSLDGYIQLMEECEDLEEQQRYLSIIHERIHSLNEMLEELFTFTKLKNESYNLELTSCCINRILKETVFSYYDDWLRKGIQPDIQITEEPIYIQGNQQGLHRVIQNVIKNGLDHGEKKIRIVLEREQNQAVLRIGNQVTCPEQINIDHVFERFYKADAARSKTSTGLGLSIAKELVERMNGEIRAKIEDKEFIVEIVLGDVPFDPSIVAKGTSLYHCFNLFFFRHGTNRTFLGGNQRSGRICKSQHLFQILFAQIFDAMFQHIVQNASTEGISGSCGVSYMFLSKSRNFDAKISIICAASVFS